MKSQNPRRGELQGRRKDGYQPNQQPQYSTSNRRLATSHDISDVCTSAACLAEQVRTLAATSDDRRLTVLAFAFHAEALALHALQRSMAEGGQATW